MRIALAQINTSIGDLVANAAKIVDYAHRAARAGAELVVFPELSITGYPPQDLLTNPAFIADVETAASEIGSRVPPEIAVLVGAPLRNESGEGKRLFNAALLFEGGRLQGLARKTLLPTYDVYDEHRYFEPAAERACLRVRDMRLGVHLCEDLWNVNEDAGFRMYAHDPIDDLGDADVLINLSATPYSAGIATRRTEVAAAACRRLGKPLVMVNQVGASGELIFDGDSRVHAVDGRIVAAAPRFEESLLVFNSETSSAVDAPARDEIEDVHDALVLGIRDYVLKTPSLSRALIGLSGGIDSSVTCALAVAALGSDRVDGIALPSNYSHGDSVEDARSVADRLGIDFRVCSIQPAFDAFRGLMADLSSGEYPGVVEENLQARARAVTLMAVSNASDFLVLCAGNKSELAVGYTTLYGDMTGGLCVLGDVFKTRVYDLARYINRSREIIPRKIIEKAPSAELRPGQTDQDDLPPYGMLDEVLGAYIEERLNVDAIVERTGARRSLVEQILARVDRHEYKRRQAPPVLRVSRKAFGPDRRMPLINLWNRPQPGLPSHRLMSKAT